MPPIFDRVELSHGHLRWALCGLWALPARAFRMIARRLERRRQMRHVADLDDYLLKDIGLPRPNVWGGSTGGDPYRDPRLKP